MDNSTFISLHMVPEVKTESDTANYEIEALPHYDNISRKCPSTLNEHNLGSMEKNDLPNASDNSLGVPSLLFYDEKIESSEIATRHKEPFSNQGIPVKIETIGGINVFEKNHVYEDWKIKNEEVEMKEDLDQNIRVLASQSKHTRTDTIQKCHQYSVSNIIQINFERLPLADKLKIKEVGRPLPDIKLSQTCDRKAENRSFTRRFSQDIYKKNNWICGCEVTNLLYCFPCLLFYKADSRMDPNWARRGFGDLQHLAEKIRKHESSRDHINSCTAFAVLGKVNFMSQLSSAYRDSIISHNNKVEKNRHILKRTISCVKFCSAFDLALGGHRESESSKHQGIFKELINFTAELDNILKEHLLTATVFKGTSNIIQNEILDSMLQVCREEISKQIDKADYLSIQCDETTDISNYCQMVLILRYFYEGAIREYFWGFIRVEDKSANGLKTCIVNEIDPLVLKTPQKLIAQAYDGANVMSGVKRGVQAQIKAKYPNAHFVHCYAHQLNLIMQKSASQNAKVRVFFNNLSAIPVFFSNPSHRCDVLQKIINKKLPRMVITRWNVHENLEKLVEVFKEIEIRCEKSITSNEASGLRRALEDPEFIFWLKFFHKILPHVDILHNQLESKNTDSVQLQKDLLIFEKSVCDIRNQTDYLKNIVEAEYPTSKRRRMEDNFRSVIAKEVCDTITVQMKERFAYQGHLQAVDLFNKDKYSEFSKNFPMTVLSDVCSYYPMLHKSRLRTELEVIYSREDLKEIVGVMNLLLFIMENDLSETFMETSKILKIIVTTPMTTAEAERTFSTLKHIKTFLRNTMLNDRLNSLAMMSINRNLVHEIYNFDDKVMEKFISMKDRRADFIFKK